MDFHAQHGEQEHRYRQLADFLPEAVYTCDTEGRVIEFNQAAVKLRGRTPVAGAEFWCGSHAMFTMDGVPFPTTSARWRWRCAKRARSAASKPWSSALAASAAMCWRIRD